MKLAHVQEVGAPAETGWQLAAMLPDGDWLDLEAARRWMRVNGGGLRNSGVFDMPITTLDAHLNRGLRIEALRRLVEAVAARFESLEPDPALKLSMSSEAVSFGPPLLRPSSFRDFYAFEGHVASSWKRRGAPIPEAWYRFPVFYFGNVSEIRAPGESVWAPQGSTELDYELEVGAVVDVAIKDIDVRQAGATIGGYCIVNDWSARDLQREETELRLGPAKGKDFATTIGPWLVTPDELEDVRHGKAFALEMTAEINGVELSRATWSDIRYSFEEMVARASRDCLVEPGSLLASGTAGTGCLLEIGAERLGRYLEPGDDVALTIERLGTLTSPVVECPLPL